MAADAEAKILDRLDKIIRVLAVQVGIERSMTERIYLLRLAGLDNATIAEVLNTTSATVRALQSVVRRQRLGMSSRSRNRRRRI